MNKQFFMPTLKRGAISLFTGGSFSNIFNRDKELGLLPGPKLHEMDFKSNISTNNNNDNDGNNDNKDNGNKENNENNNENNENNNKNNENNNENNENNNGNNENNNSIYKQDKMYIIFPPSDQLLLFSATGSITLKNNGKESIF